MKKIIHSESVDGILCKMQNVIAFFLMKLEQWKLKLKKSLIVPFDIALKKVREMPRFKNDSLIYGLTRNGGFVDMLWEKVLGEYGK